MGGQPSSTRANVSSAGGHASSVSNASTSDSTTAGASSIRVVHSDGNGLRTAEFVCDGKPCGESSLPYAFVKLLMSKELRLAVPKGELEVTL